MRLDTRSRFWVHCLIELEACELIKTTKRSCKNMNTKSILLAYASRFGSTQEVAESIAAALREGGLAVDLQPMQEVKALDRYDAVVLGAAIYNAKWHAEAHRFV